MNENEAVLLCPQAYNNLLPGSVSSQVDYYTSKVTAVVSMTLTAADIQGADLSKLKFGSLWHRHPEGAWKTLPTVTLSWLSFIPNMLCHLTLLCLSLGNWWREVPGFWLGLLSQLVTYVQAYCVVLNRNSTYSHSSHTVVNAQVSCLSLWSLKFGNQYSCSHARFKALTCQFSHSLQYFMCCKRATDVTSYIPCILSLAYNWSIAEMRYPY